MITWKKVGTALLVASLISSVLAPAAMAASKKKVGKIYLTIDSDIRTGRDGGDVEVTATGDNTGLYYVDSWEVTNDDGDTWSSSKPPQVDIILGVEDEEEYYFSNTSSSNFKLTLGSSSKYRFDKIKFVNAKRQDSNATLILTVQLVFDKDADTSAAAAPSNLQWDSAHNGNGSWNEVSSAKYYQTQLIKNGAAIGEIKDIYNTSYDFREQITAPGTYQFKVRSVKSSNSAKSSWNTSGSWAILSRTIPSQRQAPGRQQRTAAGGTAMQTAPIRFPAGSRLTASGTILTQRDIWPQDGLNWTVRAITWILPPEPCMPIHVHLITSGLMRPAYGFPECSWIPGMYLTGYLQAKDTYHLEKVHLSDKLYKQGAGTLKQRCLLLINLLNVCIP